MTYKVIKGDTLWSIAKRFLGDGKRYPEIAKRNNLEGVTLKPGMVLEIPTDDTAIKDALLNCLDAIEDLPEFKILEELVNG